MGIDQTMAILSTVLAAAAGIIIFIRRNWKNKDLFSTKQQG